MHTHTHTVSSPNLSPYTTLFTDIIAHIKAHLNLVAPNTSNKTPKSVHTTANP